MRRSATALLVLGCLAGLSTGCGDDDHRRSPEATATPVVERTPVRAGGLGGTYDVLYDRDVFGHFDDVVGVVHADIGPFIGVSFATRLGVGVSLGGEITGDGVIPVRGTVALPHRTFEVHGHAVPSRDDQVRRIVVTVRSDSSFLDFETTFSLETSLLGNRLRFKGAHRFTFDESPSECACSSTATLSLSVPPNGIGSSDLAAEDRDGAGRLLGTFEPQNCNVTATGRVWCQLPYASADDPSLAERSTRRYAYLFGHLPPDGDAAPTTGRLYVDRDIGNDDDDPRALGAWSATRVD